MFDKKNEDTFFNETTGADQASEQLMKMIGSYNKTITADLKTGSKVEGTVTRISNEYLFVDIGTKNEALLKIVEITEADGTQPVKIGDKISAFIISNNGDETILSKRLGGHHAEREELYNALKNRIPIQGKVTGVSKDGLSVKILGHRTFCPISQVDIKFTDDVNAYLNKSMEFVITRITEGGKNIIVSRIPLLENDLSVRLDEIEKSIERRMPVRGIVTKVSDFGVFVDIGGCEGLVHISELTWEHLDSIGDLYNPGQEIDCIVVQVTRKEPLKHSKISLSVKQLTDNPWSDIGKRFSPGMSVQGKVVRLTNFGAFVELQPGVDGLVHVSEMSWVKKVQHPSEVMSIGSVVNVNILAVDPIKKTISLSLKDVSNDPWRDVAETYPAGIEVSGVVAKKSKYGYFVDLQDGVTGLLVFSNVTPEKKESIKEGDTLQVCIESVDKQNRRISLSYGIKEARTNQAEIEAFTKKINAPAVASGGGSTDFGAALMAALKKGK
jgi:small subunit ribosomal protein S1